MDFHTIKVSKELKGGTTPPLARNMRGSGRCVSLHTNLGLWRSRVEKYLFPFPLATALLIGDVLTNRQSGDDISLSYNCAIILLRTVQTM
jgi:hypothetical protein